jgi:membrane fusion protein (multidrug efflux system)
MRRILYIAVPLIVLVGVIVWRVIENHRQAADQARAAKARKSAAPVVSVATAVARDIVHEFQSVGNVESTSDVRIAPKVTGRVDYLTVREGDPVTRGEILARMDPSEIQASIRQQQANNTSAEATLANAQIKYNRTYSIYKQGFIAAQDVDDAKMQLNVAIAAVSAGRAQLRNLQAQLSDLTLRSPINGFVTARYIDPGSILTAGQAVVAVQALRIAFITTSVPEDIRPSIHTGIAATATFDALPGQTFTGKVTQVNAAADPQSRQFLVRASFSNESHQIRPGMFCRVTMVTKVTHNAIVVPHEAIHNGPKGQTVSVVDDKSVAHTRSVRTGDQDAVGTAILEGVQPGEKVVTISAQPLKDGQRVAIDKGAKRQSQSGQPTLAGGGGGAPASGEEGGGGASAPTYTLQPAGGPDIGGSRSGSAAAPEASSGGSPAQGGGQNGAGGGAPLQTGGQTGAGASSTSSGSSSAGGSSNPSGAAAPETSARPSTPVSGGSTVGPTINPSGASSGSGIPSAGGSAPGGTGARGSAAPASGGTGSGANR